MYGKWICRSIYIYCVIIKIICILKIIIIAGIIIVIIISDIHLHIWRDIDVDNVICYR